MITTLPVRLDRTATESLPAQIAARVRELVLSGRLVPGIQVPASRRLAADLGVSRAVAEQAYAQLVAEGWLEGRHGSGTFVAATSPLTPGRRVPTRPRPPARTTLVRLGAGVPWIDPRHRDGWRRAWREVSAAIPPAGYDDPRGLPELRAMIAERLGRTRGIDVDPDGVIITAGTVDGLRALLPTLPAGPIAVEDPGYRAAVEVIMTSGREVIDVPARDPFTEGVAATYVTPAHQHPLGHVMSGATRTALLASARRSNTMIIEDDYDSEFRYDVAPIPALAGLGRDQVCYLGTASKTVAPSLRLGWLVPPPSLAEATRRHRDVTHDAASWPAQRAYLALLRDGYVDRVIRSARTVYRQRAERVTAALSGIGELPGPVAGMYATVIMAPDRARAAQRAARRAGFDVAALSDYTRSADLHGLVVGFGGCTDAQLDAALAALTTSGANRPPARSSGRRPGSGEG